MLLTVLRENEESADHDFKDLGAHNGGRRQVAGAVFDQGAWVTHGEHQRSGLQHQHPQRYVLDPVRVRRGWQHDGGGGPQLQGSRRGLQEGREEKDKAIKDRGGPGYQSFRKINLCRLFSIKTILAIPQLAPIFYSIIKPHKEGSSLLTCTFVLSVTGGKLIISCVSQSLWKWLKHWECECERILPFNPAGVQRKEKARYKWRIPTDTVSGAILKLSIIVKDADTWIPWVTISISTGGALIFYSQCLHETTLTDH